LLPLICSCVLRGRSDAQGQPQPLDGKGSKVRAPGCLALQPDTLGVAARLAAGRLREAGIVLEPLLRSAGLSVSQIDRKDMRLSVPGQIRFLELAANALKDPLLGFRLARTASPGRSD
jgi:hypothetical protein